MVAGGGWYYDAFQYIMDNGGVDSEEDYAYVGKKAECAGHGDCDNGEYCDGSGSCFDCSYISSRNCDAVDQSCCGDAFAMQCPSDPARCHAAAPLPAFTIVGSLHGVVDGIYTQTTSKCNSRSVYQRAGSHGDEKHAGEVLYQPSGKDDWMVGGSAEKTGCNFGGSGHVWSGENCAASPDACTHQHWKVYDFSQLAWVSSPSLRGVTGTMDCHAL